MFWSLSFHFWCWPCYVEQSGVLKAATFLCLCLFICLYFDVKVRADYKKVFSQFLFSFCFCVIHHPSPAHPSHQTCILTLATPLVFILQHVILILTTVIFVLTAPLHALDYGNGSWFDTVKQKSSEEGAALFVPTSSPSCSDRTPSASSDSGLSVTSQGQHRAAQKRGSSQDKHTHARKLISELDFEIAQPLLEVMTELAAIGRGKEMAADQSGLGVIVNGEALSHERETDILDDEHEGDNEAAPALEIPSSSSICSLSSENLPETHTEYSTHSWVQQQQMVDVTTHTYLEYDGEERVRERRPPPLVVPDTPARGLSSREAVQKGLGDESGTHNKEANKDAHQIQSVNNTHDAASEEDDLALLTTDVDDSIEELNQLILDLDPTFVPVPTRYTPLSRSASLNTNGLSHKGNTHLSGMTKSK